MPLELIVVPEVVGALLLLEDFPRHLIPNEIREKLADPEAFKSTSYSVLVFGQRLR